MISLSLIATEPRSHQLFFLTNSFLKTNTLKVAKEFDRAGRDLNSFRQYQEDLGDIFWALIGSILMLIWVDLPFAY